MRIVVDIPGKLLLNDGMTTTADHITAMTYAELLAEYDRLRAAQMDRRGLAVPKAARAAHAAVVNELRRRRGEA